MENPVSKPNDDRCCDLCDLVKATPEQRRAWLEGYKLPGFATAHDYYSKGICISRGSNGAPQGDAPYCLDRAKNWRGLVLLADKVIAATREREGREAVVNNAVASEQPTIDGTMRKVDAMKLLGAAMEAEEAALAAYEAARVTR
jgi:hypothetical protein